MINFDKCSKYDLQEVIETLAYMVLKERHNLVYEEDVYDLLKEEGLKVIYYEDMEMM